YSLLDNVFMVIDWAAACVIYFFYAAMIGLIFDKKKVPTWAKLALLFWAVSSLTVGIFSREGALSPALVIFFPFAFGIFLTGTAFNMLFSNILTKFIYFKMMLDILFLATFFSWMSLEIKGKSEKIRRVLLYSIFIIFLLGLIGCAKSLS
ncbi:MAG: hypothetical protein NDI94_06205, partial [Candidatus Woesearchaeota archaeon]|nr:hypothetical protein [Candidatus Woesearchaeota archaeon]